MTAHSNAPSIRCTASDEQLILCSRVPCPLFTHACMLHCDGLTAGQGVSTFGRALGPAQLHVLEIMNCKLVR